MAMALSWPLNKLCSKEVGGHQYVGLFVIGDSFSAGDNYL